MTWSRSASTLVPQHRGTAIGLSSGRVFPLVHGGWTLGTRYLVVTLFAPWIALTGSARRILLAIVLLDVPLQIDKNFNHLDDAAEFGGLGGFNVSVTTLALAGLYAAWLVDRLARRDRSAWVPSGLVRPLAPYMCVMALSLIAARDVGLYARGLFLHVQMFLVYVYLVGTVRSARDVRFVVTCLLCGLVLEGLIIIGLGLAGEGFNVAGLVGRVDTSADDEWVSAVSARFGGTVGSPNGAAEYLEMLLAPAVAVLGSNLGRSCKTLALLGLGLGSAALIGTLSRGGWIATALSVTIVCIALRRRGRLSRVFPWLLIGLLAALSLTFRGSIAARLTDDDLGAAHSRVPLMETASRIIADNPVLGVAANNYTAVLPDYASRHQDNEFLYTVHNQYLLVWVETGLVGLAAFLWFLIATIRRGYDRWKRSDVLLSPLALGFTAALAGQMVHMQADLFNGRPQLQLLMTVAAAIGAMSRIGTRDC
jgi:hypothetical protein